MDVPGDLVPVGRDSGAHARDTPDTAQHVLDPPDRHAESWFPVLAPRPNTSAARNGRPPARAVSRGLPAPVGQYLVDEACAARPPLGSAGGRRRQSVNGALDAGRGCGIVRSIEVSVENPGGLPGPRAGFPCVYRDFGASGLVMLRKSGRRRFQHPPAVSFQAPCLLARLLQPQPLPPPLPNRAR